MNEFLKCDCSNCGQPIEFEAAHAGELASCPHCSMETQLLAGEGQATVTAKCDCDYCGGGIEFDASEFSEENSAVPCPHCGQETKLKIQTEPPVLVQNTPKVDESKREAQLERIQEFLERNDKTAIILSKLDTLKLDFDKIIIRRRGIANMLASGLNGERTILISTLTGIQMKPGALFSPGYILFSYAGSKPFIGGIIAATQDPDAFIFDQSLNEQVAEFKAKVEKIMQGQKQPIEVADQPLSLSDELGKLAELKKQGLLSDEEFEAAKKKLLK